MPLYFIVTHKIFGVPQTINTANYVYFQAYQELFKFRRRNRDGTTREGQDSIPPEHSEVYLDEVITGKWNFPTSLMYDHPMLIGHPLRIPRGINQPSQGARFRSLLEGLSDMPYRGRVYTDGVRQ